MSKKKNPFNKRSKLEKYLERRLKALYPTLLISFNNRKVLGGPEIDIYVPSLGIAIELNGIHHYEPIYGHEKLAQIQSQDKRKESLSEALSLRFIALDVRSASPHSKTSAEAVLSQIRAILQCP